MLLRFVMLFILLAIFSQLTIAQLCFPVKKVYAYVQPVTKGNAPREERKESRQHANHLVYFTSNKPGVQLNHVWINGEIHAAQLLEVVTPVRSNNTIGEKKVLVPASKKKTYQLLFTALPAGSEGVTIPKKHQNKPLLLELQYKKKIKLIAVSDIEELETLPMY